MRPYEIAVFFLNCANCADAGSNVLIVLHHVSKAALPLAGRFFLCHCRVLISETRHKSWKNRIANSVNLHLPSMAQVDMRSNRFYQAYETKKIAQTETVGAGVDFIDK